ncbi:hypothetical protein AC804_17790 [Chryseobacterium sp. Hurlbut01]|nr:hypothetical protein AC804_17790 [Chryseobacterium sp. Hurlbut01]
MKKNKMNSVSERTENTEFKETKSSTSKIQSTENASIRIENNGYNISVKPIAGQSSFFNFTSPDGQLFHGTTNAEINFQKKAEKSETVINKKLLIETTYKSQITYKSQTNYKTVTKYIDKYKGAYPWYYILFAGFALREIIGWLWKWLKSSQWFLNLISKF